MDAYRVRTDLTRLEVALEDGLANGQLASPPRDEETDAAHRMEQPPARVDALAAAPLAPEPKHFEPLASPMVESEWQHPAAPTATTDPESVGDETDVAALAAASVFGNRARRTYRYVTSPVVASIILHGAIVLMIVSMTVATIVHTQKPFAATFVDLGDKPPEPEQLDDLDLGKVGEVDETVLQDPISNVSQLDLAGPVVDVVTPVDFESVGGPTSLGDAGLISAIPTDLGTVLPGNGGLGPDGAGAPSGLGTGNQRRGGGGGGGARNAGTPGSALFFGTKSKGDRFVFVIDNSSSMKGGRLEMALAELVKTVESLSPKQSFYVIFVSDQTYPMFYPQPELDMIPATPPNKKRLVEWLPKAILASGKNRELIKAMDMAAALRPHAVYLLWDGDMRYSYTVRLDVMTHLTAPNQWNFTVHTVGMGLTTLDSEQNLTAIAQAHGGMFRRIEVPTARAR
jgi:hypothetical protein